MDDGRLNMVYININSIDEWYSLRDFKHQPHRNIDHPKKSTIPKHQLCWLNMPRGHNKISTTPKYRPHQISTTLNYRPHKNIDHTKISTTSNYWPHQNIDHTKKSTTPKYQPHQNINHTRISTTPKYRPR